MRDGYDIYPLTGLTTLRTECDSEKTVSLRPAVFGGRTSIVWGSWGKSGVLRAWSTKSGRTVGELDHGMRVCGLRVSSATAMLGHLPTLVLIFSFFAKHTSMYSKRSVVAAVGCDLSKKSSSTIRLWEYKTHEHVRRAYPQAIARSTVGTGFKWRISFDMHLSNQEFKFTAAAVLIVTLACSVSFIFYYSTSSEVIFIQWK
jgi:hypothetical protein